MYILRRECKWDFLHITSDLVCMHVCVHFSSLQSVLDSLNYDSDNLANLLIALGQIAKLYPLVFAVKQKQVVRDFIMKKLIVADRVRHHSLSALWRIISSIFSLFINLDPSGTSQIHP